MKILNSFEYKKRENNVPCEQILEIRQINLTRSES